jgi:hypothetical protein
MAARSPIIMRSVATIGNGAIASARRCSPPPRAEATMDPQGLLNPGVLIDP